MQGRNHLNLKKKWQAFFFSQVLIGLELVTEGMTVKEKSQIEEYRHGNKLIKIIY